MLWLAMLMAWVAGALALIVVIVRRPVDLGDLGCLSDRWIATHRADSP